MSKMKKIVRRCPELRVVKRGQRLPRGQRAQLIRQAVTKEILAQVFAYDPNSGRLVWRETGDEVNSVSTHGYLYASAFNTTLLVHRIAFRIMTGEWPSQFLDHIDGNKKNNRWSNLRSADPRSNAQNYKRAMSTNSTGFLGVSVDRRSSPHRYRAAITVDGSKRTIGTYATPEQAHEAYMLAKKSLHPAFAMKGFDR